MKKRNDDPAFSRQRIVGGEVHAAKSGESSEPDAAYQLLPYLFLPLRSYLCHVIARHVVYEYGLDAAPRLMEAQVPCELIAFSFHPAPFIIYETSTGPIQLAYILRSHSGMLGQAVNEPHCLPPATTMHYSTRWGMQIQHTDAR